MTAQELVDPPRRVTATTVRCAYCRRMFRTAVDLAATIREHEAVCRARPVLQQLWTDALERAKRREAWGTRTAEATS